MAVEGRKPPGKNFDLGYTPEQVALVTRIRSCTSSHEVLGLSEHCSRLVSMIYTWFFAVTDMGIIIM